MQGRLWSFQEHRFECPSNYAAGTAMRCNLDAQDLRRFLPAEHLLDYDEEYVQRRVGVQRCFSHTQAVLVIIQPMLLEVRRGVDVPHAVRAYGVRIAPMLDGLRE